VVRERGGRRVIAAGSTSALMRLIAISGLADEVLSNHRWDARPPIFVHRLWLSRAGLLRAENLRANRPANHTSGRRKLRGSPYGGPAARHPTRLRARVGPVPGYKPRTFTRACVRGMLNQAPPICAGVTLSDLQKGERGGDIRVSCRDDGPRRRSFRAPRRLFADRRLPSCRLTSSSRSTHRVQHLAGRSLCRPAIALLPHWRCCGAGRRLRR